MNQSRQLLETLRSILFKAYATELYEKIDEFNLTFIQRNTLIYISKHKSLKMTDLSRILALHKSALTRIIDHLRRKKLVRKVRASEDGRSYKITLTPQGKGIINKLEKVPLKVLDRTLAVSSPSERKSFINTFGKFADRLSQL